MVRYERVQWETQARVGGSVGETNSPWESYETMAAIKRYGKEERGTGCAVQAAGQGKRDAHKGEWEETGGEELWHGRPRQ